MFNIKSIEIETDVSNLMIDDIIHLSLKPNFNIIASKKPIQPCHRLWPNPTCTHNMYHAYFAMLDFMEALKGNDRVVRNQSAWDESALGF